jgi:hypothetical protein
LTALLHEGTEKEKYTSNQKKKEVNLLEVFADCSLIMTQQEKYVGIERICFGCLYMLQE